MAAAFGNYAVGPYTGTWSTNDVGEIEGVYRVQQSASAQDIRAGRYGDSVIDGVYRGGNVFVVATFKEWTANIRDMLWPFGVMGLSGKVGRLMTDMAEILELTAITGTPAATHGFATITFPKAVFSPEHNQEIILGNEERNVPVVFRCYPEEVTDGDSALRWYTFT